MSKTTILIVEDELIVANHLRKVLEKAGYMVSGVASSVDGALLSIDKQLPHMVMLDIYLKGSRNGIDLAHLLREKEIPFIYLSANSSEEVLTQAKATCPDGFIVKPFREKDLLVTLEIAQFRYENQSAKLLQTESTLIDQLTQIINEPAATYEKNLLRIVKSIQPHVPFDLVIVGCLLKGSTSEYWLSFLRLGFDDYRIITHDDFLTDANLTKEDFSKLFTSVPEDLTVHYSNDQQFEELQSEWELLGILADTYQIQSMIGLPIKTQEENHFRFCFYSKQSSIYSKEHVTLLENLQALLSKSLNQLFNHSSLHTTNQSNQVENTKSRKPSPSSNKFEGIVGNSHLLLNTLDLVSQVAASDSSVLILGESGTGKERIADTIHQLSTRQKQAFIKVNCSTLPATLVESELFGHEKGAFTGAINRKLGRFELADGGTIFLDEVGEMPIELQPKLLRVLQEKEIDRLGSSASVPVNIRIIAATNRNLEKEVAEGRFRLDLYYRLNVFPIVMPSLRDRIEDIPALVNHFINYYGAKVGKKITGVSTKVMDQLLSYHWPGNIRELENIIERHVLLSKNPIIESIALPQSSHSAEVSLGEASKIKTIDENERDYILHVLKVCNGKIWGKGAAAELLNLPPSTLKSKMKRLGISKSYLS